MQYVARLAIDSRTGEIFTDFPVNHLDPEALDNLQKLSNSRNFIDKNRKPAETQFDGRKPENQKLPENNLNLQDPQRLNANSTSRNP